jgi:hypothetical protein
MDMAEERSIDSGRLRSWAEIRERYPHEWVCLLDVESAPDGSIYAARVIAHDDSMRRVLTQLGALQLEATLVHTSGRSLRSPRIEMTDEIRDIVRPRR